MGANRRRKSPSPRPSPATLRNGSTAHRRAAPAAPDQFGSRGWWTRPCCCRRRLAVPHWPSQASSVNDGLERSRSFHWDIGTCSSISSGGRHPTSPGFGGDCQRATDESPFAMTMLEKI
ncbi:hypothetical protein VPH35_067880 [Triticum aestivum]